MPNIIAIFLIVRNILPKGGVGTTGNMKVTKQFHVGKVNW